MNGAVMQPSNRGSGSRQDHSNAITQVALAESAESSNISEVPLEKDFKSEEGAIPAEQPTVPDFPNGGLRGQ